jgi:flagellar hook protein FlgE
MAAQQLNVEVISNNIANMNTVGFKRQRAEFQDLLYQTIERAGSQSSSDGNVVPTGVQVGGGVKAGSVYRITEQGTPTLTDNPLDVAIQGKGYLQILLPSGETAYTRAGNFSTNDQGQIVTEDGYTVQPGITVPQNATDITISKTGLVQVKMDGQTAAADHRPAAARQLHERRRPGSHRRQPVAGDRRLGRGQPRRSRRAGLRRADAALHRSVERRRGDGNHRPDHRPARLRDELEGHHDGRSDAANHLATAVVSS